MRDYLSPTAKILEAPSGAALTRTAAVTLLGFGIYGYTVGYWRSPLMGVYVAVKMPLLIVLTLACNGLLNGLLGMLLGSGLGFYQSMLALLRAFAISALVLGSVAPVTFFLAVNVPSAESAQAASAHSAYQLTHVFLIGVAGLVGVVRLQKLLESCCPNRTVALSTLGAWIAGNSFLGAQFSWILRPFFGAPGLEVAFLRDEPMKGSFYETVWRSAMTVTDTVALDGFSALAVTIALCAAFLLHIKQEQQRPRP